jgi:hypothetical protein
MAAITGPYIPLNNLVYYLDPYNTKSYPGSGTTAYNLIDNQTSTLSNISYSSTSFSNAGSGVIASGQSYNLSLTAGFTLMIWLNLTNRNGGYFNYISGSNSINLQTGGLTQMRWETYGTGGDLYSNTTVPLNTWTCWIGAFSGTGVAGGSATSSLYLNGVLDNSNTLSGPVSNNATFQVGNQGAPCNGLIGPTAFWNRELLAPEVRQVYIALKSRYGL